MDKRFREAIAERFLSEARSFVDEIIAGTDKYRQLQSLSEQLPHDYHGRFLVELIQNAHDASDGGECRIVFDESIGIVPCLYVANQGSPFDDSNFSHLCKMALSDKDPEKEIGSKGLGFRSVLQICTAPMVFSAASKRDAHLCDHLDGYCFGFHATARGLLRSAIEEIVDDEVGPGEPSRALSDFFGYPMVLIEEPNRVKRFRQRVDTASVDPTEALQWLSPYSLPLPLDEQNGMISELSRLGFVTVIQLPLVDSRAREAVRTALQQVRKEYVLFTPQLTALRVEHRHGGVESADLSGTLLRDQITSGPDVPPSHMTAVCVVASPKGRFGGRLAEEEVDLGDPVDRWMWWTSETIVKGECLGHAIEQLPPNWHRVKEVLVTVAVERRMDEPAEGLYSIYLPTQQTTGMAVSVNAPFYGNLARTEIDFREDYNALLLRAAAERVLDSVKLSGKVDPVKSAVAIIDLLDVRDPKSLLAKEICKCLQEHDRTLARIPAILAESSETRELIELSSVRLPPSYVEGEDARFSVLSVATLASEGIFMPDQAVLRERYGAIKRLAEYAECIIQPSAEEVADWIRRIAARLRRTEAHMHVWNRFYEEIALIAREYRDLAETLRPHPVLITQSGELVPSEGDKIKVFAFPITSSGSDSPTASQKASEHTDPRGNIPVRLIPYVAFLHKEINLYTDGNPKTYNSVGILLRSTTPLLVRDYSVESLVNEVLVPVVEASSETDLGSADASLYAQSLYWAFQLYQGAREESKFKDVQFDRLRVPTVSGWRPASDTYFSPGWGDTSADILDTALPVDSSSRNSFLLTPIQFFREVGVDIDSSRTTLAEWVIFLRDHLKVYDTPRPIVVRYQRNIVLSEQPALVMYGSGSAYNTDELQDALGFPDAIWQEYLTYLRKALQPPVQRTERYVLSLQATLDGLKQITLETAIPYARLVGTGFGHFENLLGVNVIRPGSGLWGLDPSGTADSTLLFSLKHSKWLPAVVGGDDSRLELCRPSEVWFVEPMLLQHSTMQLQYQFVRYIPPEVAKELSSEFRETVGIRNAQVASVEDSLTLLSDLASAWKKAVPPEYHSYFVGLWQGTLTDGARYWRRLDQEQKDRLRQSYQSNELDGVLAYSPGRRGTRPPTWRVLTDEDAAAPLIYVPDDRMLLHSLGEHVYTVVMQLEHIDDQLSFLREFFGENVAKLSDMQFEPLSGDEPIEAMIRAAEPISQKYPWLQTLCLSVFAFGRSHDMNLQGEDFSRAVRRFHQLRFLEVPDLRVVVGEAEERITLCPATHYWPKHNVVLANHSGLHGFKDFVPSLKAFFGVGDLEHPLSRVLDKIDASTGSTDEMPLEQQLLDALDEIGINQEQFGGVRQALTGDERWIVDRVVPVICIALRWDQTGLDPLDIKKRFCFSATSDGVQQALEELNRDESGTAFPIDSNTLCNLALQTATDDAMARILWDRFRVPLDIWNRTVQILGYPYHECSNSDVELQFHATREELFPLVRAVLRRTLTEIGQETKYRYHKQQYAQLEVLSPWNTRYWELPYSESIPRIQDWVRDSIPQVSPQLLALFSVIEQDTPRSLIDKARRAGVELDHDDDTVGRSGKEEIDRIYISVLEWLIAAWGRASNWSEAPPSSVYGVYDSTPFSTSDAVLSICELKPLGEEDAMRMVLKNFTDVDLFKQLGIGSSDRLSLQTMDYELAISKEDLDRARQTIDLVRHEAEKRGRIRTVLGAHYLVPRGEILQGLADHVDEHISADFGAHMELFRRSDLGSPPQPRPSTARSREGGAGGKAAKPDMLSGAVAEYLVYKALHLQLGPWFTSSCWMSSYRKHVFPDSAGDDELGYDFAFTTDGIEWQIEVKAVTGSRQFVDLGPSEVRAAKRAARLGSKTQYTIYIVRNPLSEPRISSLGNPYSRADRRDFRVDPGGSRVFFRLLDGS